MYVPGGVLKRGSVTAVKITAAGLKGGGGGQGSVYHDSRVPAARKIAGEKEQEGKARWSL